MIAALASSNIAGSTFAELTGTPACSELDSKVSQKKAEEGHLVASMSCSRQCARLCRWPFLFPLTLA